ncbi:MAG: kdo(2)-lipid A phosphoethanolamine 7''-transferase [Providencia heimbachae]|nr:kdo(2)-lipid A phosphoethanolamine 7''-transferase [Providencia heimbachae]
MDKGLLLKVVRNDIAVSIILAIYLGFFLNYSVYISRFHSQILLNENNGYLYLVAEIIVNILFSFFLFRLVAVLGLFSFKLLSTLIILISIAISYYITFYDVVVGYGILISTLTTDIDLSQEVIDNNFFIWLLLLSIPPVILIWFTKKTVLSKKRSRLLRLFTFILIPLLIFTYIKLVDSYQKENESKKNIDISSYGGGIGYSYLPTNWMIPLVQYGIVKYDDSFNETNLLDPFDKFTYKPNEKNKDVYVVFVIGETARWDHMQLLGYQRETTPRLASEKNVIAFKGTSCDTSTKLSLRCMFVREGGVKDNEQRTVTENNIFSVMKQLGFSSNLFSMQSEVWFYNKLDVDNYLIREMITSKNSSRGKEIHDELLLDEVDNVIQDKTSGMNLIILHTKGSHYLYSKRYPAEFKKFMPECIDSAVKCSKEQLINSYDNSILYTDTVISNLIDRLKDKNAIVFYTSDHGESIEENKGLHGTPRKIAPVEQFRVPLIVWMSDTYMENNKGLYDNLKQNSQSRTFFHHEIFDSLLGCLGYTSTDGGINNKNNLCFR